MKRHAFVTGASGFLGRNLIEELTRQGWEATALCLPSDTVGWLQLQRPEVNVVTGDIADLASLVAAMPTCPDAVFHLAANTSSWSAHDDQQYQDNVVGTDHVLDAAVRKRRSHHGAHALGIGKRQ